MRLGPDMDAAAKERSGGNNHASRTEASSLQRLDTDCSTVRVEHQSGYRSLNRLQVWLLFEERSDCSSIKPAIALSPRCPHSRTLAAIQHSELNHGKIGGSSHDPSERIYLAYDGSFSDTANRRIA